MDFETWFQSQFPAIPTKSAAAVLSLSAEGATIPFIARYRKEQTGNLDEVGIQNVIESKEKWDSILRRQEHIVSEIDRQKKLTPELKEKVLSTFQLELLEDIYLPYKQKRKTKAAMAKDKQVSALNIRVDTDDRGAVTLSGKAKNQAEADKAVALARSVEGVVSVQNNIQVGTM